MYLSIFSYKNLFISLPPLFFVKTQTFCILVLHFGPKACILYHAQNAT